MIEGVLRITKQEDMMKTILMILAVAMMGGCAAQQPRIRIVKGPLVRMAAFDKAQAERAEQDFYVQLSN